MLRQSLKVPICRFLSTANNKTKVLVTGSTDGIGLHTATKLAKDGYHVYIHGR